MLLLLRMDSTQHRTRAASLARTLTTALANPYNFPNATPYPYHPPAHRVNPQGYTYSSAYNPLTYPPSRPYTSFSSPGYSFGNVSSASGSRNTRPSRGAPQTHWYTPGNSNCIYSSCTFTGSANSVKIHMMDRHLIYPPGWHTRKRQSDWDADPSLKGYVLVRNQWVFFALANPSDRSDVRAQETHSHPRHERATRHARRDRGMDRGA